MVGDEFAPGYEEAVSYRHGTVSFNTCRVLTLGADTTILYIYVQAQGSDPRRLRRTCNRFMMERRVAFNQGVECSAPSGPSGCYSPGG